MSLPLIVVTGPPASGKSSVARALRNELHWPLIGKDNIKERLFDLLGWSDLAWSKKLSAASYALMFDHADELAAAQSSFIIEGNFRTGVHDERFAALTLAGGAWIQVFCSADRQLLAERFKARARRDERHPGHRDLENFNVIQEDLANDAQQPLNIGGRIIRFDSTILSDMKVAGVVREVRLTLRG
jgi:predicted kinase